jgi:hypothetical protein
MKLLVPYRQDDELAYESLWVIEVEAGYQINNIPFLTKNIAFGDVVEASEEDGMLYFEDLIEASGHSTIRVLFWQIESIQPAADELIRFGCDWEGSHVPGMIAVDVPPAVDYAIIKAFLEKGFHNKIWDYQEACLGFE